MTMGYVATLRNAQLNAITTAIGASGLLLIYNGVQPATGGSATTLLASLPLSATAAPGASAGVLTFSAITSAAAAASGTATWFRLATSASAAVIDGTVTATGGGGDLQLNSTAISSGATVSITSGTITAGNP
jgi:hypothetical protein